MDLSYAAHLSVMMTYFFHQNRIDHCPLFPRPTSVITGRVDTRKIAAGDARINQARVPDPLDVSSLMVLGTLPQMAILSQAR